ncbi:MAG: chemotaxis protein CheW [Archangium sp.]|nr:chemotaxis protein CheW [Archangium sp.]
MATPHAAVGPASAQQSRGPEKFLTFHVGKETFAMPIAQIREVLQFESVTTIPMTPAFVRGVLNLRGAVVPVIDLAVRFDRAAIQSGRRTCVVIVEVKHESGVVVVGVLVDQVNEVVGIDQRAIEKAPTFGSSVRADFVRGVGNLGGRFVVVLDVTHVLSVSELASLTGLGAARA